MPPADASQVIGETVVRSSCRSCGTVNLAVDAVTVYLVNGSHEPTYGFRCPGCSSGVRKSTSREAMALLMAAGVLVVQVPAEVAERPAGEPLSLDDLIDLGRALARTEDLVAAAAGTATAAGPPATR